MHGRSLARILDSPQRMIATGSDNRSATRASVAILRQAPDDLLPLSFHFARTGIATVVFDNEHELDNWLRHCVDPAETILAAIIDQSTFERTRHCIVCKEVLAAREIPLLIVGTAPGSSWTRIDGHLLPGMSAYLTPANLLPQLLEQLRQKRQRRPSGKDRDPA